MCIDPTAAYEAKVSTTKGDFTIKLDAAKAPLTVNNFVVLARYHYFDGIPFHRVIKGFMGQTGDGVGPELGSGPGYTIPDELPASVDEYQRGAVAMANTGEPNSGGSQWFVVFAPGRLATPAYSLFGQVTDGLDTTIAAIEAGGADFDPGVPTDPVYINTITITPMS
ncbi:MAG: peptidylprolyl isomerase [Acidimicrobiales bacterium]|nr:peptidylprolyl isomerase [Acidimicrobiales bacterium]